MLSKLARALERLFEDSEDEALPCSQRSFELFVRCGQCAEIISVRVDRDHDLQAVHGPDAQEGDPPAEYVLRKELVGEDCQNLIRFTIRFDCDHGLIDSEIEGGEFIAPPCHRRAPVAERAELTT